MYQYKKLQLSSQGLLISGAGINLGGLILVTGLAIVLFVTDTRWWVGVVVLAFIPLVMIYAWGMRRAGFPVGSRSIATPVPFPDELKLWAADGTLNLSLLESHLDHIKERVIDLKSTVISGTCTWEEHAEAQILIEIISTLDPEWGL